MESATTTETLTFNIAVLITTHINMHRHHTTLATLLIIGLSSSLSIGSEVLCTQLFVQR